MGWTAPRWSRPTRLTTLGQDAASPRSHAAWRSLRLLNGQRENRICDSYVTRNRLIVRLALQRLTPPNAGLRKETVGSQGSDGPALRPISLRNCCQMCGSLGITQATAAGITDHVFSMSDRPNPK